MGGFDAASVVRNADQLFAAVCNLYRHSCGTSVNGVFYKLLHNRGRTFYHLAGRDLINGMFV